MFEKVSDLYLCLPAWCYETLLSGCTLQTNSKNYYWKQVWMAKLSERFDGRHGDEKVTQGTWQSGQVGQGCQFGYKAFPSVLLTIWRFYSPSFALILYSVLITKSSPFFSFFLGHMLARCCQAEVWHPFGSLPSFLFFQGSICACKNMLPERIHPGN